MDGGGYVTIFFLESSSACIGPLVCLSPTSSSSSSSRRGSSGKVSALPHATPYYWPGPHARTRKSERERQSSLQLARPCRPTFTTRSIALHSSNTRTYLPLYLSTSSTSFRSPPRFLYTSTLVTPAVLTPRTPFNPHTTPVSLASSVSSTPRKAALESSA